MSVAPSGHLGSVLKSGSKSQVLTSQVLVHNHVVMKQISATQPPPNLDALFAALADPTRRAILSRLAGGQASVADLCVPFEMSQPAVSKHLKVLERAGLVTRDVDAQRRPARLNAAPMQDAVAWLEAFEKFWSGSFDQLDTLLEEMKTEAKGAEND